MQENNELNELLADTVVDEGAVAEALLNEIEMGVAQLDETSQEDDDLSALIEEPVIEVLSAESDAELGIDRAALYADQGDGEISVADPEDTVAVEHIKEDLASSTSLTPPGKKGRVRKSPATPGAAADATTRSGALKKKADVNGLLTLGLTQEEVDDLMATIDAAPKKVGEKANNLIRYALGREHISNFTRFTMSKLRDNPAGFTVPDLVKMMQEERSYSVGTARSQAQQQSRLFGLFGMVSKDGSKIALDGDNPLTKAVLSRLNGDPFVNAAAPTVIEDDEPEQFPFGAEAEPEVEAQAPSPAPVLSRSQRRAAAKEAAKHQEPEAIAA